MSIKSAFKNLINSRGFTLVELLIVVSVIGVLSGVVLSVIDVDFQQETARDAVRAKTLETLASAIEGYYGFYGQYPASEADPGLLELIDGWPNDPDIGTYNYGHNSRQQFGIVIEKLNVAGDANTHYYKYRSTWGEIRECNSSATNANDPTSDACT